MESLVKQTGKEISMYSNTCRFCGNQLATTFVDLGMSPLSNSYVKEEDLNKGEVFYPLHALVCEKCFLVQLNYVQMPQDIFGDYAYFSSYSESWLKHAQELAFNAVRRFNLNSDSKIIEVASNDGYLLQYFRELNFNVLGIEPSANVAACAIEKGISTIVDFFGTRLAHRLITEKQEADLIIGNNVLAHVPDINDFIEGMKMILKPGGTIIMEFPHLLRLIEGNQFDTIYHEHFSYISLLAADKIFKAHDLCIYDVEELTTHGGSLRIYAKHADNSLLKTSAAVKKVLDDEIDFKLDQVGTYAMFSEKVRRVKYNILDLLIKIKNSNKEIAGYGAPAKGNTLLNYCGIRSDFISYTVDRNPYKQGKYLPGTHIPVFSPEKIKDTKPDYILILPWNIKDEVISQLAYIRDWGGKFIIPVPEIEVI